MSSYLEAEAIEALDAVTLPSSPLIPALYWPPKEALFEEQDALIAMAKRLNWKYIIFIIDQIQPAKFITSAFNEAAAQQDICVVSSLLINTNR